MRVEAGRDRVRRRRSVVALIVLAVGFALSVGAERAPGTTARNGGTLRVAAGAIVGSLDPGLASDQLSWAIEYGTCATLTAFADASGPAGFSVRFEAAAGPPKISHGGRRYDFTIRSGLRFSNGTRLAAANFKRALDRVLDPAMRSPGAAYFSDVTRISADGRLLRIELSDRSGNLLTRLALPFACPVPREFPADPAGVTLRTGSGPYFISNWVPGSLTLARNRYYHGARPHSIDRLVMTTHDDVDGDMRAVAEGRSDVLGYDLSFAQREALWRTYGVNRKDGQLFRSDGTVVYYLALNMTSPLFRGNLKLRQAVNFALDRDEIVRAVPAPHSHIATDQIIPRWTPDWVDRRLYPGPNLQLAQSLADGNQRGGKAILYTSSIPAVAGLYPVIVRQLGRIGLDVTVKTFAPPVLAATAGVPGAPYDMLLTRYDLTYPDPAEVLVKLLAGENASQRSGNTNLAYFDSPMYDRKIAAAERLSGTSRAKAFSELDADIMRNAAPWAPLLEGSRWLFFSSRVGCLRMHPVFRLDYAGICLPQ